MNKLLASLALAAAVVTSGCALYFEDDHGDGVRVSHYCEGTADATTCYTCYRDPNGYEECFPDAYGCASDSGCAAGCYCDEASGACVEAGYCTDDPDCGFGLTCDCSGSCVPVDTETRSCTPDNCWTVGCPDGETCTSEGVCVVTDPLPPATCDADDDCAPGSYCANGVCEETSACASDTDCADGQFCDVDRATCVPTPDLPSTACWTVTNQTACEARTDCRAVVAGTNCTRPDGSTCQPGDSSCTCEGPFTFQSCVPR